MSKKLIQDFDDLCSLRLELGHNGFQGGDAGHGGYVTFSFQNIGNTHMEVNGFIADNVEITFKGDAERRVLLRVLETIVERLNNEKYLEEYEI